MKTKRSHAENSALVCSLDSLWGPLSDNEVAELHGNDFWVPLVQLPGNSDSYQIEEEDLKQLICLLIWKRMEREMLDENFGLITQLEQQLDSFGSSFDEAFK